MYPKVTKLHEKSALVHLLEYVNLLVLTVKNVSNFWPSNPTSRNPSGEKSKCGQRCIPSTVHPSFVCNRKTWETSQCLTTGNVFTVYIVHTYNGIYYIKIMVLRIFTNKKMFKILLISKKIY